MIEYKTLVVFPTQDDYLNELAREGWTVKTAVGYSAMTAMAVILERKTYDAPPSDAADEDWTQA